MRLILQAWQALGQADDSKQEPHENLPAENGRHFSSHFINIHKCYSSQHLYHRLFLFFFLYFFEFECFVVICTNVEHRMFSFEVSCSLTDFSRLSLGGNSSAWARRHTRPFWPNSFSFQRFLLFVHSFCCTLYPIEWKRVPKRSSNGGSALNKVIYGSGIFTFCKANGDK